MLYKLAVAWAVMAGGAAQGAIFVAQDGSGDFNGRDATPVLAAIEQARKAGGGEVVIKPGEYTLARGLRLSDVRNLSLRGEPGAVLKLGPACYAETAASAEVGQTFVAVRGAQGLAAGQVLRALADGAIDKFTGKPTNYFLIKAAAVDGARLTLAAPLAYMLPAGTRLLLADSPNLIELRDASENVTISGLVLDGGRRPDEPAIRGHAELCGVFAQGKFNYTDGPLGPPVRRVVIRDCEIRHCFGRGVALYSAAEAVIEHCRIHDTVDEAIDLDHFSVRCRVLDNEIARALVGVEMNDANECWVARNRFEKCGLGIHVWRWCKQPDLNARNMVLDNLFLDIESNAVALRAGTEFTTVRGNHVKQCGRAGMLIDGHEQLVSENTIEGAEHEALLITGERSIVRDNRCYDGSTAHAGKHDGIRITGNKNRVLDNVVTTHGERDPHRRAVTDEGKGNVVREAE